jgi:hypothetical protein
METQHTETVVDKAVNFVKDVLGIQHDDAPEVVASPEYHDGETETAAENAMQLDPNAYKMQSLEQLNAETYARPEPDSDTERSRGKVDEFPRKMSALELNAANARAEENG